MAKMNKNVVPENFSVKLAIVDLIPVVFFALTCILLGIFLNNILFIIGAIICFVSGLLKVIWKIIVAIKKKNIWALFLQMLIAMPIGFLLIIISIIISIINGNMAVLFDKCFTFIPMLFIIIGFIGMVMMSIFAFTLDSSNSKANWIEQICNSISQISFFIAMLCII